ncbi:uncharacterized protein LOC142088688 isoform X2 [Calonectris borealis]|uniref:uncharacterized protein LOC142088688 isoform X2 n=1 Tax=Calonectris borealis TaxID=1323832 RepID=UPI003F4C09FC
MTSMAFLGIQPADSTRTTVDYCMNETTWVKAQTWPPQRRNPRGPMHTARYCSVKGTRDITSMCWGRDSCPVSKCYRTIIWTDGWKVTEQYNSRYMLKGNLLMGDVSLTIVNAEEADSGIYCCRVEISGWFNDQTSNHKVVIEKARISTASPHTYTSEQTSAHGSASESSFTITRTWPSVSASEAPRTASGPCSSTLDCSDVTSNLQGDKQQHHPNFIRKTKTAKLAFGKACCDALQDSVCCGHAYRCMCGITCLYHFPVSSIQKMGYTLGLVYVRYF